MGPGVYRWLNAKHEVLYIGKAKNLRQRLRSYVAPKVDKSIGPWKLSLREKIADFDVILTRSELEALILETNLIKEVKPKYNVLMKDDKDYVYVRLSLADPYPSVEIVRRMGEDNAKYFGPFLSMHRTKATLDMLHEVFGFRACPQSIHARNQGKEHEQKKPCLDYQIGRCSGLCIGELTQEEYRRRIEEVMRFFRGDRSHIVSLLKERMHEAAAHRAFEKAAKFRNMLGHLLSLDEEQTVSDTTRANTDAVGIAVCAGKMHVVLLRERNGKLVSELNFVLSGGADTPAEALEQFLPQYYSSTPDLPETLLLPYEVSGKDLLQDWLTEKQGKQVTVYVPQRGKKSKVLDMAMFNAQEKVRSQLATWEAQNQNIQDALVGLKTSLNLPGLPERIEGYDISHLSGTETVGSMVTFRKGVSANDHYRSFMIRTMKEGEIDDYKAMREILRRRLLYLTRDLREEEKRWKEKEIVFGKARKADMEKLSTIVKAHPGLTPINIDYRNFRVARRNTDIVGCVQLYRHPAGTLEVKSLWVDKDLRGSKLGQMLLRKVLTTVKQGKVYVTSHPDLEDYYTNIGFQPIRTVPSVIQERLDREAKEFPERRSSFMGHYDVAKHKDDISLKSRPNLLIIDGGKGQLNAACEVLKNLSLEIPVIGLAKREEEVFVPGESSPVPFVKDSPALFLLMRIRDEAHRRAHGHNEKRRGKRMLK